MTQDTIQLRFDPTKPSNGNLTFTVTDGSYVVSSDLRIFHLGPPKITNVVITCPNARPVVLTPAMLFAANPPLLSQNMSFTVVVPFQLGNLTAVAEPSTPLVSFTAAAIADGAVQYVPDAGKNGTYTATLNVSDGMHAPVSVTVTVLVNSLPHVVSNREMFVKRNGSVVVANWAFDVADTGGGSELTFRLPAGTNLKYGCMTEASAECLASPAWRTSDKLWSPFYANTLRYVVAERYPRMTLSHFHAIPAFPVWKLHHPTEDICLTIGIRHVEI